MKIPSILRKSKSQILQESGKGIRLIRLKNLGCRFNEKPPQYLLDIRLRCSL